MTGGQRPEVPLTVNSATNNQLPHFLVTIGDKNIHSLLDTGCSANIINSNLFDQLSLNNLHPTSIQLCGINKSPITVRGESKINVSFHDKSRPVDFIVADIGSDLVLGNPFIQENELVVNLKNRIVTISGPHEANVPLIKPSQSLSPDNVSGAVTVNTVQSISDYSILPHHATWINIVNVCDLPIDAENTVLFYPNNSENMAQKVYRDENKHDSLSILFAN